MKLKKPWRRYYYHASHYDIDWPCEASNAKAKARPACASLFANSNRAVSYYGGNLYRFKLRGSTPVLIVSEGDYYSYRHDAAFRSELFLRAKRDGFKAIICPISRQDISVVVLDFTAFKSWERVCG